MPAKTPQNPRKSPKLSTPADLDEALRKLALDTFQRYKDARRAIAKDGAVIVDARGSQKRHPAILIERDARQALVKLLEALGQSRQSVEDEIREAEDEIETALCN